MESAWISIFHPVLASKTSGDSIETNQMTIRGVNRSTSEENNKNVEFLKFLFETQMVENVILSTKIFEFFFFHRKKKWWRYDQNNPNYVGSLFYIINF